MLVTLLRNMRVRFSVVRKGVLISVGSSPLVATSTSIGVNSHEFVSLTSVDALFMRFVLVNALGEYRPVPTYLFILHTRRAYSIHGLLDTSQPAIRRPNRMLNRQV
jgi:hypothetical protein